jgi:hypothetical protein
MNKHSVTYLYNIDVTIWINIGCNNMNNHSVTHLYNIDVIIWINIG